MSKIVIETCPFTSNYNGLLAVKQFIDDSQIDKNSNESYRMTKIVEINDYEEFRVTESEPYEHSEAPCDVVFKVEKLD